MTRRRILTAAAGVAVLLLGAPLAVHLVSPADAQEGAAPDPRFAGLEWTFARVRYSTQMGGGRRGFYGGGEFNNPWTIDMPAAEQNLSRRIRTVTTIKVNDPIVVGLEDENLWQHPWLYVVEPGNLNLSETEAANLREFLLRGGTVTFDDFHGPYEWANLENELRKVFPDRQIVELEPGHPIFSCFYKIDAYPQIPGIGSFSQGRTWEKGGYEPHLRAIVDDRGRAMVLINWNTDMADAWEWSNAQDFPGYLKYTAESYRMQINEIIYALTH